VIREDFERLYTEHVRPLLNFVLYRTGDRALAEDIASESLKQ
jgi:DNA-directed RNA polymerase specialized sigma24 family protein